MLLAITKSLYFIFYHITYPPISNRLFCLIPYKFRLFFFKALQNDNYIPNKKLLKKRKKKRKKRDGHELPPHWADVVKSATHPHCEFVRGWRSRMSVTLNGGYN